MTRIETEQYFLSSLLLADFVFWCKQRHCERFLLVDTVLDLSNCVREA